MPIFLLSCVVGLYNGSPIEGLVCVPFTTVWPTKTPPNLPYVKYYFPSNLLKQLIVI